MNSFTSKCSIKKYRVENPIKPNSLRLVTPKEWNSSGIRIVFSYWHTGLNNILILTWFCLVWNQQFSKHVFTSFENYLRISNKLQKINQLKRNIIKRNEMIQNPSTKHKQLIWTLREKKLSSLCYVWNRGNWYQRFKAIKHFFFIEL